MRLLFLILLINYSYSQNSDFDEANMLYNEGRYIDAIDVYNKILDSGLHSSDLYFNIGNSYYKINDTPNAIFYYEKALLLEPENESVKNNLAYAQNMLIDKIETLPKNQITDLFYSIAKYVNGLDINNFYLSSGRKNKSSINLSAQYGENFYFGINFNIYDLYSKKSFRHLENNFDSDSAITLIDFRNDLLTRGKGFSVQLGMIYKLKSFRFGLSYNSPTSFNVEEELMQSLETNSVDVDGNNYIDIVEPDITNIYEYDFVSPSKIKFGASNIFANMFIISIDVESNNYRNGNFKNDYGNSYDVLNRNINQNLKKTLDYSIGSELRLKSFSLRAGIKRIESPYKSSTEYLNSKSMGLGYDFGSSTLDLGIQIIDKDYDYQFFDTGFTEMAQIKNNNFRTTLTYNIIF